MQLARFIAMRILVWMLVVMFALTVLFLVPRLLPSIRRGDAGQGRLAGRSTWRRPRSRRSAPRWPTPSASAARSSSSTPASSSASLLTGDFGPSLSMYPDAGQPS